MRWVFIIPVALLSSCNMDLPTAPELFINYENVEQTIKLQPYVRDNMNGVYRVTQGADILGDEVVGRWVQNSRWCMYSKHDVVFSENMGGSLPDSSILMSGYIRIVRSGSGMLVDLNINKDAGAVLLKGSRPKDLVISGTTLEGKYIEMVWQRPLKDGKYYILAHRGGGRNSERLGISENSLEMIKHAEIFGANAVEIDVRKTRDNQLILFHDDTFSPRTVTGAYLLGRVENFDLLQIQYFGRLINNEKIPTLREALNTAINNTTLSLVWIDMKQAEMVDSAIKIISEVLAQMPEDRKDMKILLGIPEVEVFHAWENSSLPEKTETRLIIEFDPDLAITTANCDVWAPRWTDNTEKIPNVKDANKIVFIWTLDVHDYIEEFIDDVEGILTDYPSLLAGMYYSK